MTFNLNAVTIVSAETTYSNVIEDLTRDSSFNISTYPKNDCDYSLSVIQIAEGVNNELFLYIYNPSADRIATSINMSTSTLSKNYINYKLTLIDSNNTLSKYKVDNFVVSQDVVRNYEITSVYRFYDEGLDKDFDKLVTEIPYKVNKLYEFVGFNEELKVKCSDIDYIEVTDKFVGFCRYSGSGNYWQQLGSIFTGANSCDSHFIAFSTDKSIDKLLEADVYYVTQSVSYYDVSGDFDYGELVDSYSYLVSDQEFTYSEGIWTYTRGRIQSVTNFLKEESEDNIYDSLLYTTYQHNKLTSSGVSALQSKEWILRFYESSYQARISISTGGVSEDYTSVQDVSILRLKFETDGVVYDLGVIDNKQSSLDNEPVNEQTYEFNASWLLILIIILLIILILLPLIGPWLPTIFKYIWKAIKFIFKIIWLIITLPYKLLKKLIGKE